MKSFIDQVLPKMTDEQLSKGIEQVIVLGDAKSQQLAKEDPIQESMISDYCNQLDPLYHLAHANEIN